MGDEEDANDGDEEDAKDDDDDDAADADADDDDDAAAEAEADDEGGGRGGSLSPGRSGIRGPARPFASQSKTQGSPLGGYLSWLQFFRLELYLNKYPKQLDESIVARPMMELNDIAGCFIEITSN